MHFDCLLMINYLNAFFKCPETLIKFVVIIYLICQMNKFQYIKKKLYTVDTRFHKYLFSLSSFDEFLHLKQSYCNYEPMYSSKHTQYLRINKQKLKSNTLPHFSFERRHLPYIKNVFYTHFENDFSLIFFRNIQHTRTFTSTFAIRKTSFKSPRQFLCHTSRAK